MAMTGMLVALDQLTKLVIIDNFRLGESKEVLKNIFNITRVHNPGAAFGFLAGLPEQYREPFFLIVPVITLLIILAIFSKLLESQLLSIYSLSLIVAGAIGNLIDRIRLGYVVDFLDFHWQYKAHFPAFNVADSAISAGVFILLLSIFLEKDPQTAKPPKDLN